VSERKRDKPHRDKSVRKKSKEKTDDKVNEAAPETVPLRRSGSAEVRRRTSKVGFTLQVSLFRLIDALQ